MEKIRCNNSMKNEVVHRVKEVRNMVTGLVTHTNCVVERVTEGKRAGNIRGTVRRVAAQFTASLCWLALFLLDRTRSWTRVWVCYLRVFVP